MEERKLGSGYLVESVCTFFCEEKLIKVLINSLAFLCVLLTILAIFVSVASLFSVSSMGLVGLGIFNFLPWLLFSLVGLVFVRHYISK
jgi:hypothetical protein